MEGRVEAQTANDSSEKILPPATLPIVAAPVVALTEDRSLEHPLLQGHRNAYSLAFTTLPLIYQDGAWNWQCLLCVDLPSLTNKLIQFPEKDPKAPLVVSLQLHPDARWGDGTKLSGEDLIFSWQLGVRWEELHGKENILREIHSVEKDPQDPGKVLLYFRNKLPDINSHLSSIILLPAHLERAIWQKSKNFDEYIENSLYQQAPLTEGLYNGPFLVSKKLTQEKEPRKIITLLRNSKARVPAILRGLDLFFFSDKEKMLKYLASENNLTIIPESEEISGSAEAILSNDHYLKVEADHFLYEHIAFNLRNPILKNANLRKALFHSLDKKELRTLMEEGFAPATTNMHPHSPYYTEKTSSYPYSLTLAGKLLDESGWKLESDGYRYRNGVKLSLLISSLRSNSRQKLVKWLFLSWKKIGVEMVPQFFENRDSYHSALQHGKFAGLALFSWKIDPSSSQSTILSSAFIPQVNNDYTGQNVYHWVNQKSDEVFKKLGGTYTQPERKVLFEKLQQEYIEDLPAIPLFFRMRRAFVTKTLSGFQLSGPTAPSSLGAHSWRF